MHGLHELIFEGRIMEYSKLSYPDMFIKPSYDTIQDNLLVDFYIPVLEHAKRYDRISGFFSSTSLAIAARGIAGLIRNKGKMRLLTCQKLSKDDVTEIQKYVRHADSLIGEKMISEMDDVEDAFKRDHVAALGYMLQQGYLEMKIAVLYDTDAESRKVGSLKNAILHQKIGILYDSNFHGISFSGSNNESATGWLENIEEFKTFKSWKEGQKEYFMEDCDRFERLWNLENDKHTGMYVMDLPDAVKQHFLQISNDFRLDSISTKEYLKQNKKIFFIKEENDKKEPLSLYYYQKCAVNQWIENGHKLMLQMATGTGKTRTAFGCMECACRDIKSGLIIVVATPQITLTRQWIKDMEKLQLDIDEYIEVDGTIHDWRINMRKSLQRVYIGQFNHFVIFTTHDTASNEDFIDILQTYGPGETIFFIGDEVHGMGADKTRNALQSKYEYRLGLSATPKRWFDDEGSHLLEEYFGNKSFHFGLREALETINPRTNLPFLANYYYYPCFISLTDDELEKYRELSQKISRLSHDKDSDLNELRTRFLMRRAEILKNAENKYQKLHDILEKLGPNIQDTIIFVSPQQIDKVMMILREHNILAHRITEKESQHKSNKYSGLSEREYIIKQFETESYQVIVAIKCMDEGIDIPSARCGIIMASSTNPREYVQRIGRIIRQDGHKSFATLYDVVVEPEHDIIQDDDLKKIEKKVYEKEMARISDLSKEAINRAQVVCEVYQHR